MADHEFVGVYAPGYMRHPDMPPLLDAYWDPFWASVRGAQHRRRSCTRVTALVRARRSRSSSGSTTTCVAAGGTEDVDEMFAARRRGVGRARSQFFFEFSNKNLDSRRPMWQLMLGGVFDRHPELKLDAHRDPARLDPGDARAPRRRLRRAPRRRSRRKRKPSEYWHDQLPRRRVVHPQGRGRRCATSSASRPSSFGRDYPHPESTWPHTERVAARRVRRRARGRGPADARRERHPLLRPRPRPAGRHRASASGRRSRTSPAASPTSDPSCSRTSPPAAGTSSPSKATSVSPSSTRCSPRTSRRSARCSAPGPSTDAAHHVRSSSAARGTAPRG